MKPNHKCDPARMDLLYIRQQFICTTFKFDAYIKLARLRRQLSAELIAERAGISRATLWSVEKGSPSVAIGIYAAVLHALNNLDKDLLLVAKDDEFGRKMQDLNMQVKKRAPKGER